MAKSIFIDSNIWFSAIYGQGVCSNLFRKILKSQDKIFINEIVLEEVIKNISLKLPKALPLLFSFIKEINPIVLKNPKLKTIKKYQKFAKKHDLPILASTIEAKCNFFVTGNIKDFNQTLISKKTHLKILAPADFEKEI